MTNGLNALLAMMGGERTEDRVVLDAVPDGWAKINGEWMRVKPVEQDYQDAHWVDSGEFIPDGTPIFGLWR